MFSNSLLFIVFRISFKIFLDNHKYEFPEFHLNNGFIEENNLIIKKDGNNITLVKHLDKSEAMGNVNNVCTDKTGTLTLGVMRVTAFYIEGEDIRLSNNKINDEDLRELVWNCIYKNITCVETVDDKGKTVLK